MNIRLVFALVLVWGVCTCLAVNPFDQWFTAPMNGTTCNNTFSCMGKGDSCSPASNCSKTSGNCCAPGLFCINGTCATDTIGDWCNTVADCRGDQSAPNPIACNNNTCTYLYGPGEACETINDCWGGLNCSGGTCQGIGVNGTCNVITNAITPQCNYGLYCAVVINGLNITNVCMPTTPAGNPCNATSAPCAPGSSCFNGTCTSFYSLGEGAQCAANLCDSGYVCAPSNGTMTCQSANTDMTSCTTNSDCSDIPNSQCQCSFFTGDSYCSDALFNPCTDDAEDLQECLNSNSCLYASDAPNSCCYEHCYSDYKDSISCNCDSAEDAGGSCFYNDYCGGFPVWAIIVIIVVAIVLVLVIVLLVFFMMRRRSTYDTI